jgi:formylmethanofuran dehydrogenase subunit C
MNRGTIISLKPLQLMPTFVPGGAMTPTFLNVYSRHLKPLGIHLPYAGAEGVYRFYAGDTSVSDKGEILVWQPAA